MDSIFETKSYDIIVLFVMLTSSTKFIAIKNLFIMVIGERSEPLSMVFNDQPRDIYIYIWPMSDRTYVSNTHAHVCMSI